LKSITIKIF